MTWEHLHNSARMFFRGALSDRFHINYEKLRGILMSGKAKKILPIMASLLVFALALTGCGASGSSNDILIGVMTPTSGSMAYYGKDMNQAYQLAADQINAKGGVLGRQLKLFFADDGGDASIAANAAAKIIAQKPNFVIGGYSSNCVMAAMKPFYDANLLFMTTSANSTDITKLNLNNTFMLNSPATQQVETLMPLLTQLNLKNVALINQGDAYTKNLSDLCQTELPQNGFSIATVQVMEQGIPDISPIVTAIKNSGADCVYWCGYFADGSNVVKQLKAGGFTGQIIASDGNSSTDFITGCGSAGDGVYVVAAPYAQYVSGGAQFISDYQAKYNQAPGAYASVSYDGMYVLAKAIENAGTTDYTTVRDAVQNIDYQGISGHIKFTADRELQDSNFIILQIEGGQFQLVPLNK